MPSNHNLRFVHLQFQGKKYSGMTIAYERSDTNVYFSYALCAVPDTYEKAKGRTITTDTYLTHMDEIHSDVSYLDKVKRVGCFCIADMRECLAQSSLSGLLADHVIGKMTFMDLKHAALSAFIEEFIVVRL